MTPLNHITYNGSRISYGIYGQGSHSLVLFHGLVGSASLSHSDLELIEQCNIRLIIVERPGYGNSDCLEMNRICDFAPMAEAVLDKLKIDRIDLAGTSAGAPFAWAAAAAWEDRVNNLFILAGVPAVYKKEILELYHGENLAFYEAIPEMSLQELQTLFSRIMTTDEITDLGHGEVSHWLEASTGNRCHGMASQTRLQIKNWGTDFDRIQSKVHLFHSPADEEVPFEAARKMTELVPGSRLTADGENMAPKPGEHMASINRGMKWILARYQ